MLSLASSALSFTAAPMMRSAAPVRAAAVQMAEAVDTDQVVLDRYLSLPVTGKVQAE